MIATFRYCIHTVCLQVVVKYIYISCNRIETPFFFFFFFFFTTSYQMTFASLKWGEFSSCNINTDMDVNPLRINLSYEHFKLINCFVSNPLWSSTEPNQQIVSLSQRLFMQLQYNLLIYTDDIITSIYQTLFNENTAQYSFLLQDFLLAHECESGSLCLP